MKNAVNWFEITTTKLDKAQAFYEAVLGRTLRREVMVAIRPEFTIPCPTVQPRQAC